MNIKECPFCGSNETHVLKSAYTPDWAVECLTCDAFGPSQDGADSAILSWNEGSPRWKQFFKIQDALKEIADGNWKPTLATPSRDYWMQQIAQKALK